MANPVAFTGLGDLAFVWQDALYTLSGDTGELRLLTKGKVVSPAWSHDGEWVAFIRPADQAPAGSLWLIRRDGTQEHQVKGLPKPVGPGEFSWSPSADVLAVGGDDGLWVAPADGDPYQLQGPQGRTWLAWSPDGKALAFSFTTGLVEPNKQDAPLLTVTVEKGYPGLRLVALRAGLRVAAWWPDGKGLLYWLDPQSASLEADGMRLYSLALEATSPKLLGLGLGYRPWLTLSPNGQALIVEGAGREVWNGKGLVVSDVRSGTKVSLTNPEGRVALDPALSPDGSRIAFVAARERRAIDNLQPNEVGEWPNSRALWVEMADGSGAHPLSAAGAGVFHPMWAKDGQHILYGRDNALWVIDTGDGKAEKVLGPFPGAADPVGFYGFTSYLSEAFSWRR